VGYDPNAAPRSQLAGLSISIKEHNADSGKEGDSITGSEDMTGSSKQGTKNMSKLGTNMGMIAGSGAGILENIIKTKS
jgi:hypothetical protein